MRALARSLPAPVALLTLGCVCLTGASPAQEGSVPVLPDALYPKMVSLLAKGIQDSLKGTPREEMVTKARTAAIMVAAVAQQNLGGADGQQRATVRDAALAIVKTIEDKKYSEAAKRAAGLATLKADPKAKKDKIALLDKHITVHDLMNQFNHPPEGGWGIHRELYQYQLGMKGIPASEFTERLALKAYQVAVAADLLASRMPKANGKEWAKHSGDVRQGAVELAEAVKGRNVKAGLDGIAKITNNCTGCHKIFGGGPK